ncbi:MAG: hypothetical protein ACXAEN_19360 [Candidatus Thorarchaeota archaeon]|jgi:hypothetical protein
MRAEGKWFDARCMAANPKIIENPDYFITGNKFGPVYPLCVHINRGACPDFEKGKPKYEEPPQKPKKIEKKSEKKRTGLFGLGGKKEGG